MRQGPSYHAMITGDIATRTCLPIKRSADLVHWQEQGAASQGATDKSVIGLATNTTLDPTDRPKPRS